MTLKQLLLLVSALLGFSAGLIARPGRDPSVDYQSNATASASASPSPITSNSKAKKQPPPGGAKHTAVIPPEKAKPIRVPRFDKAPVIDGRLDDEAWKSAVVFKDFYQWEPTDAAPASARTEVRAGYDSHFLYFAFHAFDDPAKVRATVARRDAILNDDAVGLYLDT